MPTSETSVTGISDIKRPILFIDIVQDYPAMGGVARVSEQVFRLLARQFSPRVLSARSLARRLGLDAPGLAYLDRERQVAQALARHLPEAILFFPNFQSPVPGRLRGGSSPVISLIHDLQFAFLPQYFPPERRAWLSGAFAEAGAHSDCLVFVSQTTRRHYLERYGPPRNHAVIYNPIELHPRGSRPPEAGAEPFLLASMHAHAHKNFAGLFRMFEALIARVPNLRLLLTGHGGESLPGLGEPARIPPGRIRHLGHVDDGVLQALSHHAAAFVSLSEFEGFNMSAALAACHGTPLILSDLEVHRELFGQETLFLPAHGSPEDGAERIAEFLAQPHSRYVWNWRHACSPARVGATYAEVIRHFGG